MKILTVLTGGTIGSTRTGSTVDVSAHRYKIIQMYKRANNDDTEFDAVSPMNILSENMSAEYWNTLVSCISGVDFSAYDGIIVTHGSDTLSYTAALLSMCFAHIEIPLVLTAADCPLENEKSNGLQNFSSAVALIKSKTVKGVFVSYGGRKQTEIYLASRLREAEGFSDKFRDFTGVPFALRKGGKIEFIKSPLNPSLEEINQKREPFLNKLPKLKNAVLMLTPYPGFDYNNIALNDDIKAVLQLAYHSGTVSAEGRGSSLELLAECRRRGVDFYLCPLKNRESLYITTRQILEKGAIPLYSQSREAAFAKLMLAYSQNEVNPREITGKNIFFEIIEN